MLAYHCRGNILADKGDLSGELSDLNQAIILNPRESEFYANRGISRMWSGDTKSAFIDFEKAIEINPRSSWAYYCRARGWYNRNDFNRSVGDLNRAIELDPQFFRAFGDRGLTLLRLGRAAEAEKDFAECLRLDPKLKPDLERSLRAHGGRPYAALVLITCNRPWSVDHPLCARCFDDSCLAALTAARFPESSESKRDERNV